MVNVRTAATALNRLFVYGTLKAGEPNHYLLKDAKNGVAKYWCRATTSVKMPLVIGTRYNIPFLINKEGIGSYVTGEIYEVDDKMIDVLDNFEDCQRIYKRAVLYFNIGIGEGNIKCFTYLLNKYPEHLLSLPHESEYKHDESKAYIAKGLGRHSTAIDELESVKAA